MKVNSNYDNDISFKGFYNNKLLKKGLEFAANNGALFAAATTLTLSTCVRPFVILATPKVNPEDKKVACAKSVTSSLIGYAIMLLASKPVSRAISNIDKNPEKYLQKKTIKNLKENSKKLTESKAYEFSTQIFKLGIGALVAAPKAILTALGLPYVMQALFNKEVPKNDNNKGEISFRGKGKNNLSKGIAKLINNNKFQDFSTKYKDSNFPMHIMAATDALTTSTFIHQTKHSSKIDEGRKKPLIYNAFISTTLSIAAGYGLDKLLDKPTEKFINKFKDANKNDKKLNKYIEGIKIAKPILILGGVYYIIIPFISTLMAEITNNRNKL